MLSKAKALNDIREDLKELSNFWVVAYGSYVKEKSIRDIDIAVITKIKEKNKDENMRIWYDLIGKFPPLYDIRIFELMPLTLKISVINNHEVIFGKSIDISEYFYFYRKLWNDQKHRIEENKFKSYEEKIRAMKRGKKIKGAVKI